MLAQTDLDIDGEVLRLPFRACAFDLLFDSKSDDQTWPHLLSRDIVIGPKDDLETILESHFHDVDPNTRDPMCTSPELKRLLKVIVNAILYATSAGVIPVPMESPIADLRRKKTNSANPSKTRCWEESWR
jgi:hypothetical protein